MHQGFDLESADEAESLNPAEPEEENEDEAGESGRAGRRNKSHPGTALMRVPKTVGDRMPPSGSAFDNIDLTNLKNWIAKGAKNN